MNGASSTKKRMRTVQSGIGISSLDKSAGSAASSIEQNFLTSRTARVLLAGAGFLADAVRPSIINCWKLLYPEMPLLLMKPCISTPLHHWHWYHASSWLRLDSDAFLSSCHVNSMASTISSSSIWCSAYWKMSTLNIQVTAFFRDARMNQLFIATPIRICM